MLRGRGVADRVGDVDGRGAGRDHRLDDAAQEVDLRPRGILGGKLHVAAQAAGPCHPGDGTGENLLLVHPQLEFAVDRAGGEEHVDSRLAGMPQCLPGPVDVGVVAPGQTADRGGRDRAGDVADAFEVPRRGDRKPGLDDVDAELHERLGDLQLLREVHARAGGLFAVPERGVEDADAAGGCHARLDRAGWAGRLGVRETSKHEPASYPPEP
jgi:hypothetical protein